MQTNLEEKVKQKEGDLIQDQSDTINEFTLHLDGFKAIKKTEDGKYKLYIQFFSNGKPYSCNYNRVFYEEEISEESEVKQAQLYSLLELLCTLANTGLDMGELRTTLDDVLYYLDSEVISGYKLKCFHSYDPATVTIWERLSDKKYLLSVIGEDGFTEVFDKKAMEAFLADYSEEMNLCEKITEYGIKTKVLQPSENFQLEG